MFVGILFCFCFISRGYSLNHNFRVGASRDKKSIRPRRLKMSLAVNLNNAYVGNEMLTLYWQRLVSQNVLDRRIWGHLAGWTQCNFCGRRKITPPYCTELCAFREYMNYVLELLLNRRQYLFICECDSMSHGRYFPGISVSRCVV